MTHEPSSHKFALAVGVAGAMVDVSPDVLLNEGGVMRNWGRQSSFADTAPGQFAFTLDNRDGKYTPDNPASTLDTRVTEGMRAAWELNGTLRSGKIKATELIFVPEGDEEAARLRVTVADVLADAARTDIDSLPESVVMAARPYAYWPMDDAASATAPRELSGRNLGALRKLVSDLPGSVATFGSASTQLGWAEAEAVFPSTPLSFYQGSGLVSWDSMGTGGQLGPYEYPAGSVGFWSAWITRTQGASVYLTVTTAAGNEAVYLVLDEFGVVLQSGSGVGFAGAFDVAKPGVPTHVAMGGTVTFAAGVWTTKWQLWVNGVAVAAVTLPQYTTATDPRLGRWDVTALTANGPSLPEQRFRISHLAHTPTRVLVEDTGSPVTAAARIRAIAATVPTLVLDTLPADLSPALLGAATAGSALDLLNTVIRGEQGHIYSETTGTLLAPVEKVKVRARTRPEAVTEIFSIDDDIHSAPSSPDLQRNTTNMVSAVAVTGATEKVVVYQRELEARVSTANTAVSVALLNRTDLEAFGQDRILRGINHGFDVVSIQIDPGGTKEDRWADLMALTPGLRYQVGDLPAVQLGTETWDGWFLGAIEQHSRERSLFTLFFEPVLARTAVYDTDRYMAAGALKLSANVTLGATSLSVATNVPGTVFTTAGGDLPVDVVIGAERMRVTAATSATPQVLTVTRGVNGTTPSAHAAGDLLELATISRYAY